MNEKKLYHIYKNQNGEIHCEVHPVIYSNEKYIYYKVAGNYQLLDVERSYVFNTFEDALNKRNLYELSYFNTYTYTKPEFDTIKLKQCVKNKQIEVLKDRMNRLYSSIKTYTVEYEEIKKELEELENDI